MTKLSSDAICYLFVSCHLKSMRYIIHMPAASKSLLNKKSLLKQNDKGILSHADLISRYPFQDISPHLVIKNNPRAKRLALRVDPKTRTVNLVIPKRTSMRRAYLFALEHKYWIKEQVDALPSIINLTNGTILPLFGQEYHLNIDYSNAYKTTSIHLENNQILVHTNKADPTQRIIRFLKHKAQERLSKLAHQKADQIGQAIKKIDIKDTSSRWGSCSDDGKISLSWRLIFAPWVALDYVVAHEVAHRQHMDHSPAFWTVCEALSEDYSAGKSWMHRHSHQLNRYQ